MSASQVVAQLSTASPIGNANCRDPASLVSAATLQVERSNARFQVESMSELLWGGKKRLSLFRSLALQMERDATFKDDGFDVAPKMHRELIYKRVARMMQYKKLDDADTWYMRRLINSLTDPVCVSS